MKNYPAYSSFRNLQIILKRHLVLAFLFTLIGFGASAQKMITGRVTADSVSPIVNVNVSVQGSTSATLTDKDGIYTIAAGDNATLVFKLTGYTTTEVYVNGRTVIDVILPKNSDLGFKLNQFEKQKIVPAQL